MTDFNDQRCATCLFWERQGAQIAQGQRDPSCSEAVGVCRLRAPVMAKLGVFSEGMWPRTHESRWCGDWDTQEGDGDDGGGEEVDSNIVPFGRAAA